MKLPFQMYLPHGQRIVSVGSAFSIGSPHTGQFFCHFILLFSDYSIRSALRLMQFAFNSQG
jgi:hypothetical protein